jgi:hypothetical protein
MLGKANIVEGLQRICLHFTIFLNGAGKGNVILLKR